MFIAGSSRFSRNVEEMIATERRRLNGESRAVAKRNEWRCFEEWIELASSSHTHG